MFESILIRQTQPFGTTADAGLLAEALLFYNQTIIAANRGDLVALLKAIGPDDFIGLIKDGHIAATFIEDVLATHTQTTSGMEEHSFVAIEHVGNQKKGRLSREEKLIEVIRMALGDLRKAKKIARTLLAHMPHRKINVSTDHPSGITGAAFADLDDANYVRTAVQKVLETYTPIYAQSIRVSFDVIKSEKGFVVGHNIDLAKAGAEFHAHHAQNDVGNLTTAFILNHLLAARGEMFLSSEYLSELVTTPITNTLIDLRFRHLLVKPRRNADEIRIFQHEVLEGHTLREAINSGERSFAEFRRLLDGATRFKEWTAGINPDRRLIAEYLKAATAKTWVDSLPAKAIRFALCSGAALIGDAAGLGAGAADTFLVEKIFRSWRPHHFVQGPLTRFVDPSA